MLCCVLRPSTKRASNSGKPPQRSLTAQVPLDTVPVVTSSPRPRTDGSNCLLPRRGRKRLVGPPDEEEPHPLALRNKEGTVRDVLLTDAPGEWFTVWSKAPDHEGAAGARWVVEHSNVILLLADSSALADEETLPQARRATRDLTERVGALASHIPVGFTWTKTDIELSVVTRDTIERARSQFAPASEIWKTTIETPASIAEALSQAIVIGAGKTDIQRLEEPRWNDDPFLAFRGFRVRR